MPFGDTGLDILRASAGATGSGNAPLVVVSHRGPCTWREVRGVSQWARAVGGLSSALDPVVRACGGTWLAGADPDTPPEGPPRSVTGYDVHPVPLSAREVDGYYRRVANGVLWPLLHSFPSLVRTHDADWRAYRGVNQRFAIQASKLVASGGAVWVHDFQLALVPGALRALRDDVRVGWFCHVPWPAPEIIATLPDRDELLRGLLGADLLGFQTARDAKNFLRAAEEVAHHTVDHARGVVVVPGDDGRPREVRVEAFPIGIDVDAVQALASSREGRDRRTRMRERLGPGRLLLAVDRLDYTKGIPARLHAFAELLRKRPHLHQRVSLVQVAVPSRIDVEQYASLKREVDELVGQLNGRLSRPGWTPIHYLYRALDLQDLVALYGIADVAVVTPLRDGMNLVAHEFAAARIDNDGVLVLSEFAGAASVLDGPVLVNPYDKHRTAEALARALAMEQPEREERMRKLRLSVRRHRVSRWHRDFLGALGAGCTPPTEEPVEESVVGAGAEGVGEEVV